MDNLLDKVKKVKIPDAIHIAPKSTSNMSVDLKAMKKELENKMNEKVKIYGFIGMEVYDLSKAGRINIPEITSYLEKMDGISAVVSELEKNIAVQEAKIAGKNICSCGFQLKPQDRFCPNCGEAVPKNTILCTCGTELDKNCRFCTTCGKKIEDLINNKKEPIQQTVMRECICGAKVPEGQFMCMECGRKVE
ncbi:MAG: zinc ribbon domain-containing protein [Clostridiales bacterium]|nr:zinc ribbon domain-containing protein [Clostridiales bacterium]